MAGLPCYGCSNPTTTGLSLQRSWRIFPTRCWCHRRAASGFVPAFLNRMREPMKSKRTIGTCALKLATAALLLATTHAFAAGEPRFDGVTLRVATYGGPWKDGLNKLIGAEMEKLG